MQQQQIPDTDTIEDLARKIMQASPGLGWHSAWIKAVRLFSALDIEAIMRDDGN